jgi:hypothetical protein
MALLPPQQHRRKNRNALSAILSHSGDSNLLKMGQLADTQQCDVFSTLDSCSKTSKVKQGVGKQLFIRRAPIYTLHDITRHITDIHCDIKTLATHKAELKVTNLQNHFSVEGYCCITTRN